jgi:hypothetical protein
MPSDSQATPRVFISYSWTSEEHTAWVGDLGERLMSDGIDVVLDQWSLEDGHDIHVFMEKMVTDPGIKRVIIISDALYAAKADGRTGGVGTETQIISKEVYDSVDQTKFVPVVRERDNSGNATLPVYLRTRKYIDFSDRDKESEAYDQLLRNIFERPQRRKPALGAPPSHLFNDEAAKVTSAQKATRFCDFVKNGKGNPAAAFHDFADEFVANLQDLRMDYFHGDPSTWCARIRENIGSAAVHRDTFVDAVYTGAAYLPSQEFVPLLIDLLERLLQFRERPDAVSTFVRCSEDNYKFLCYELFLYTVASFVKAKKLSEARQLIDYQYVISRTFGGGDRQGYSFTCFNSYAESLEKTCAQQGNQRRYSVMADLIHDRATNKRLSFSDVLQSDALLCLAAEGQGWFPRCMVYAGSTGKLELFVRAANEDGLTTLKRFLKINTSQDLLKRIASDEVQRIFRCEMFWASGALACFNLEELQRRWGPPPTSS